MNEIGNAYFTPVKEASSNPIPTAPRKEIKRSFSSSQIPSNFTSSSIKPIQIGEDSEIVKINLLPIFSRSESWETIVIVRTPSSQKPSEEKTTPKSKQPKREEQNPPSVSSTCESPFDA